MIDVVLSGPGKNALSSALMQSLRHQLARAEGQPVLVRGEGDAFSAGLNFFELATLDAAGLDEFLAVLEDLLHELYNYPGPTVALVSGHAIAGGCLVAMCCDHRVCAADPRLKIGLNEVALGLHFPGTALALARRRVNPQSLDEVAAAAEAVARQRLGELASHPADAYGAAKRAIRGGVLDMDPAQRRAEREALLPHWTDPALRARIGAFLAAKAQAKKP